MPAPIFITGIGTGIGKTLVAAIITEALQADYWKPIQAGISGGTDTAWVQSVMSNSISRFHPEKYRLAMPASPHIASREVGVEIQIPDIVAAIPGYPNWLVVEGAGGLLVPLNKNEFVADLAKEMGARIILVSRNYLGSINHSLLTAAYCHSRKLDVAGWIFNDQFGDYEAEIAGWTGFPVIGSVPFSGTCDTIFIRQQAELLLPQLKLLL